MRKLRICIPVLVLMTMTLVSAQSDDRDYKVGIEDVLNISVWGEEELNRSVRVRPDGKVTFPLVNDVPAEGLSADQIREVITERISTFIREPNVTVIVEEINSFKVYVLGRGVNGQGIYNLYRPTRLLQALAEAGGFADFAKREIVLLRDQEGVEQRIVVAYKRLVSGEGSQENLWLKPGDILLVE